MINGSQAFTALGAGRSTGTRLFALAGHVRNPGVYEVEMVKTTFRDLVFAPVFGGGIPGDRELKAIIPGGVSAPWFGPEHLDLPLGQDEVGEAGSMLGSGSIVVMDDTTCVVHAVSRGERVVGEDPPSHRGRRRPRGGCGPAHGRLRQPGAGRVVAAPADDDLRLGLLHPVVDRIGDPDVSRRDPRAREGRGVSPWLTRS
jgi:hypothetical protein